MAKVDGYATKVELSSAHDGDVERLIFFVETVAEHLLTHDVVSAAQSWYGKAIQYCSAKIDTSTTDAVNDEVQRVALFCFTIGQDGVQRFVARKELNVAGQLAEQLVNLSRSLGNYNMVWQSMVGICEQLAAGGDNALTLSIYQQVIALVEATWFMQPIEEESLHHFFASKAALYDGLALCYLRLGAYSQAWESLEAAKTRYLGDLIVRRQWPTLRSYELTTEDIWTHVRRAQAIVEGRDEEIPAGMVELIGLEPSSDTEPNTITVPQHRQALEAHPGELDSSIQLLVRTYANHGF